MSIFDGRGRWYRLDKKRTVDELLCLDISWVAKQIDLDRAGSGSFSWTRPNFAGEHKSSIGYDNIPGVGLRLRYSHGGESIEPYLLRIEYTEPHYGGRRPWFICPNRNCGRRVRKLYGDKYYLCRNCQALTYEVCQRSHKEALQTTITNRMRAIRHKLGASGSLLDPLPDKPKYMHWDTYRHLCSEYNYLHVMEMAAFVQSFRDLLPAEDSPALDLDLDIREEWRHVKKDGAGDTIFADLYDERDGRSRPWYFPDEPEPDRLTLGQLAKLAGVDYAFAQEAVQEDLVRPDGGRGTRVKRYRRRLASWLRKLHELRQAGYSWDEIRDWTRRRWKEGHEEERQWPV